MTSVYIDSNVFFYAKIRDRTFGESCAEILRQIMSGSIRGSISTLVPLEVSNALRKFGLSSEARDEIAAIFSLVREIHPLEATDVEDVATMMKKYHADPYDCAHAAIMKRNGIAEIISADKDFDQFQWVRRNDPRSYAQKTRSAGNI